MAKFLTPILAPLLAATLAGTTGYCVLTNSPSGEPPAAPVLGPPVRLLPPAIDPYPYPEDNEAAGID